MLFSKSTNPIINQKRSQRAKAIASAHVYVDAEHSQYTRATGKAFNVGPYILARLLNMPSAPEIVRNIESEKWTASQVLEAYIARASLAHATTNCGTEGTHEL